ncbi:MAG: hypothetical protein JRJ58_22765 [Deltaproteobacteria bacterium]|nr:hypothetical protein [Deltaproteobacteria bacterium]
MRILLLTLLILAWAMPTLAAQTLTVPLSVVTGSVALSPFAEPEFPVKMPLSQSIHSLGKNCTTTQGTVSAEVIRNGLEIELDGETSSICTMEFTLKLTLELESPELGGTSTAVRLDAVPVVQTFVSVGAATVVLEPRNDASASTSSIPGVFDVAGIRSELYVLGTSFHYGARPSGLETWVPGDTIRMPILVRMVFPDTSRGTVRVRYQFLVTVPGPAAALGSPSAPRGWLAGRR